MKGVLRSIPVTVTVKYKSDGKDLTKSATENLAIVVEDMQDLAAFAKVYGQDEVKDEKSGEVTRKSEKDNPLLILERMSQSFAEYACGERNRMRNAILETIEGPAKTIEKTVKLLVASGFSEEQARAVVTNQRKAKGLPV